MSDEQQSQQETPTDPAPPAPEGPVTPDHDAPGDDTQQESGGEQSSDGSEGGNATPSE